MMVRPKRSLDVAAAGAVLLFLAGCAGAGVGGAGTPRPARAAPRVPVQFDWIGLADWTIEKPLVGRMTPCENGKAAGFDCRDVDLLAFLPVSAVGGTSKSIVNDIWGWTDPASGREFVLLGRPGNTAFIEISDLLNPRFLGTLLHTDGKSAGLAHDMKVYKNHAFIVGEGGDVHGMQVFDLTQLLTVTEVPAVFEETVHYDRIENAHNIVVDTATGFVYTVGNSGGGETCGGGLHMVDVHDPVKPVFAGCYAETLGGTKSDGYVHDAQCVVYHGPDRQYEGRELCLNAAISGLGIVDVTDKHHPKPIGIGRYPNARVTHQGWLTDDQRYFFLGDEGDEGNGRMTRTIVFDLADLADPVIAKEFFGTTTSIDHNLYIRGHYVYQSNYGAGLRVLDIADPRNPKEVAYFDTDMYGKGQIFWFSGSWSNYPFFKSGVIAVSSMGDGLFLLRHRMARSR